jgi:hypothetical protein
LRELAAVRTDPRAPAYEDGPAQCAYDPVRQKCPPGRSCREGVRRTCCSDLHYAFLILSSHDSHETTAASGRFPTGRTVP